MPITRFTMTTADVARALGLGDDRVRDLDPELKPERNRAGHRRYDPAKVEALLRKRAS